MSGIGVTPGVPPKRPVYQLSHSSLPSSLSTSDDSLSHSTNTSTCDAGREAVVCSLLARPPTPTPPPRPPRHVARSHDKRPKTAPPSAIGTSLSRGLCTVEGSCSGQPIVVFRRWRVGSTRGFVATRVAPPPSPPPTRPLPYPPAQYNHRRLSSGPPHSDTAQTHHHVATQPPMPILPIFPSRDSSSSSTSTTSPSDTSMLAVPLLHPFAAHEGPPTPKREQSRHSNQCAQLVSSPSPQKHRSKFTLPLISGSSHSPPAPVPFPVQHTPSATSRVLASPSYTPIPSSSTLPTFPLSSPPHSLQFACAAPSSSTLPATNTHLSQDSLSGTHCAPPSAPFRLRGPLGHPLVDYPISAAVENHQLPSSVTIRPRPYSTHNKRAKSALRTSQSPHSRVLLNGEDEGQRPQALGVPLTNSRRVAPDTNYSPCSSSVLNPHGGLDSSRRRHHPFLPDAVPYPRNYERTVLDLDAWDTLWLRQACKSMTFHKFKDGEQPRRVLDVGCGSGTWVLDCATTWKESTFVGLDIVPIQPNLSRLPGGISKRVSWVHANFLEHLPFSDEEFDFVHIKRIARGVPEDMWDNLLEELARVMKPGAALEIIEEDLTFPGRSLDADDASETKSSGSTIGCEGTLSGDRYAEKGSVETARNSHRPGGPRVSGMTKVKPEDLPSSPAPFTSSVSPRPVPPQDGQVLVGSGDGRDRGSEQTPYAGQDAVLPTLCPIQRSRSLTHASQRPKLQRPWTPQTPGNKKRPTTANSEPSRSTSRSESQANLRVTMAVKAAASCLTLSGKRSKSKKEHLPATGAALALSSCISSASVAITAIADHPPMPRPNPASPYYHSASASPEPPPPPLPPLKRSMDATGQAVLMEATMQHYLLAPYPGARMAAAGINPAGLFSKGSNKKNTDLRRGGAGNDEPKGANLEEVAIPGNPRDHTVLETIYNEMHADRFVNLTPLSLLGNALGTLFKDVRTHEPLVLRFPPPREELERNVTAGKEILSAADLMEGKSPYASVDGAQFTAAISPRKVSTPRSATTTTNGLSMEVDLRTLNLHLAVRVKEILGCTEAMWDWVVDYQTKAKEGEREPRGVYAAISELSRTEFDEHLAKFELDMEEHMAFGRIVEDRLGWSTNLDTVSHDKRAFHDKWSAYLKSVGSVGVVPHPSMRWSRSVRAFVAWKPLANAT